MSELMESKLVEALDLLEQGFTADEVAARYPEDAEALRPFLLTAAALPKLATQPTIAAQQESRRAFLAAADQAATLKTRPARLSQTWMQRLVATALAVLAIIFVGGAGLVGASASTVPGDALYETKRFVEEARLRLATDPERAANLRLRFEQERIDEVERLLAAGRVADVSFSGTIEAMPAGRWMIAGLPVDVGVAVIDGQPDLGTLVQVDGRTEDGAVAAERITVLTGLLPEQNDNELPQTPVTPLPPATIRPADDNNNNSNEYDEKDDNANTNGSGMPGQPVVQPTPTPSLTSTVSPSPLPSAPAATPDDDDNDNDDDDNANDNDDGGDDNANDNDDGGDDNANDNDDGGDDNANDNGDGGDDNANDNDDDDNSGPGGGDDNANDNGGGDDNANDNGDDDNSGPGGGDDNTNANDDEDNSGGGDDDNDNDDENDNNG